MEIVVLRYLILKEGGGGSWGSGLCGGGCGRGMFENEGSMTNAEDYRCALQDI
jgi:hypothetical protein